MMTLRVKSWGEHPHTDGRKSKKSLRFAQFDRLAFLCPLEGTSKTLITVGRLHFKAIFRRLSGFERPEICPLDRFPGARIQ
jgi:hypothetical protein